MWGIGMKKYVIQWILISSIIGFLLFWITSLISNTTFNNIFLEFEIMLMLIGFTTIISTMIVCSKFIVDKIDKK